MVQYFVIRELASQDAGGDSVKGKLNQKAHNLGELKKLILLWRYSPCQSPFFSRQ